MEGVCSGGEGTQAGSHFGGLRGRASFVYQSRCVAYVFVDSTTVIRRRMPVFLTDAVHRDGLSGYKGPPVPQHKTADTGHIIKGHSTRDSAEVLDLTVLTTHCEPRKL